MRIPLTVIAAALVFGVSMLASPAAYAQDDTASCSFFEIQASNDGKGVDAKLKPLKKKLERPPFSAWAKFDLLARHDKKLALSKTELLRIATDAKLSVLYREYTKGKKERFKLRITLQRKNGKRALGTDFIVDAGDYLVISMPTKEQGKSYLLAVTCKK